MNTRIAASSHSRCGGATRAPQSAILTRGGKTSTTATTTSSRTHFFREHRTTAPTRRRRQETKTRRSISSSASNTEGAAKVTNENDWDADQLMRSSLRLYDTPDCRNLLVVGPGVLGSLVCQKWLEMFPAAIVVGQTNSTKNHERLEKMGITARTEGRSNILILNRSRTLFSSIKLVRTIIPEKSRKRWKNGMGRTVTLDFASRRRARCFQITSIVTTIRQR